MTNSSKIAERTGRRNVSIQTKENALDVWMTTGDAGEVRTTVTVELTTGASAKTAGFADPDKFWQTPDGWKAVSATGFDPERPFYGSDRIYVDGMAKVNITAEADARPQGPVDVYVDDEVVATLQPGETFAIDLRPLLQRPTVQAGLGVVGVAVATGFIGRWLGWW